MGQVTGRPISGDVRTMCLVLLTRTVGWRSGQSCGRDGRKR